MERDCVGFDSLWATAVFAIRAGSKSGNFLDGERIFDAVSEVGPHAPDGFYALVGWRHYPRTSMVTLEWSRIDSTTVVGRLKAPQDIQLVMESYRRSADQNHPFLWKSWSVVRRVFVETANRNIPIAIVYLLSAMFALGHANVSEAQADEGASMRMPVANSSSANEHANQPVSPQYEGVQHRLARGWNTWDVHSVTTHVLLPGGLAIHIGLEHNSTEGGDAFLPDALIGRLTPGAEQVFPGEHSWDGSSTDLRVSWKGHSW